MASVRYSFTQSLHQTQFLFDDTRMNRAACLILDWQPYELALLQQLCQRLQQVQSQNVVDVYDLLKFRDQLGLLCEHPPGAALILESSLNAWLKTSFAMANAICDLHKQQLTHGNILQRSWSRDEEGILNLHSFSRASKLNAPEHQQADLLAVKGLISSIRGVAVPMPLLGAIQSAETAETLKNLLAGELLRDQHRGQLLFGGTVTVLDRSNRSLALTHPLGFAALTLTYTGTSFVASVVSGEVLVNNVVLQPLQALPGACVLALGYKERKFQERFFLSWEQSSPEIVQ